MNAGKIDSAANRGKVTFAVFNQNPGNIKPSIDKATGNIINLYPGEITSKGAKHRMFDNWENGTAAMFIHLWRYMQGFVTGDIYPKGTRLDTIEKIGRTWAPETDNNKTEEYIDFVANKSGIGRTTRLEFNQTTITALVRAMAPREDNAAAKQLTPSVLSEAWATATKFLKNIK